MRKLVLIASLTALAAFAAPVAASASPVWGPVGTTSSLDATNPANPVSFSIPQQGVTWTCAGHHLGLSVRKPASSIVDVTSATFSGCKGSGSLANCTITQTPTGLPWTMQAFTTTNIRLNVANVNVKFTTTPGSPACPWAGGELSYKGALGETGSSSWNPTTHALSYASAGGMTVPTLGGVSILESATLVNAAKTLTLF